MSDWQHLFAVPPQVHCHEPDCVRRATRVVSASNDTQHVSFPVCGEHERNAVTWCRDHATVVEVRVLPDVPEGVWATADGYPTAWRGVVAPAV